MAIETVGANGQNIKRGKEGFVRFGFPANHLGNPAFTGELLRAYVQDWNLQNQFKNVDATPLGYGDGEWYIPDGVSQNGSCKFNFRVDSLALLGFISTYASIIDHGATPAEDVVSAPDSSIAITMQCFVDKKHYWELSIVLESISTGAAVGQTVSYDVSFKVNGGLQWHRLPEDLVEA
jgi:hypothetical protein